jgi:chromosome segregation ATPase
MTDQEKFDFLDKKIAAFANRIARLEASLDASKQQIEQFSSLRQDFQAEQTKTSESHASLVSMFAARDSKRTQDHNFSVENRLRIDELEKFIKSFESLMSSRFLSHNQSIHDLAFVLKEIEKDVVKKQDLDSLKIQHEERISSAESNLRSARSNHESLSGKVSEFITHLSNDIVNLRKEHAEFIKTIQSSFSNSLSDVNKKITDMGRENSSRLYLVNTLIESLSKEFDQKLVSSPSSLGAAKEEIYQKFKIAELDASNSLLKSQNNEQHIKILERKLESALLLIKKFELNQ